MTKQRAGNTETPTRQILANTLTVITFQKVGIRDYGPVYTIRKQDRTDSTGQG